MVTKNLVPMMKYVTLKKNKQIALVTVARPQVLNALNREVLLELRVLLRKELADVRALILTGAGDKAFIAGADIKEISSLDQRGMLSLCELGQEVANLLEHSPFVTIAAVNGYALGGGLEMALACDWIYASKNAKLGLPEVSLGLIPGFGGTQRLARAVGMARAKEMILTGKPLSAEAAYAIGLVNGVCDPEDLLKECEAAAENVIQHSFKAVSKAKQALNASQSIVKQLELERQLCAECLMTPESQQAISSFLGKNESK